MDRQTSSTQIPVNTRTVGKPSGIYILYLEDYVHTLMNKLLAEKINAGNGRTYEVALYGKRFDEDGRSLLVISGAAQNPFSEERGRLIFPSCSFIGNAKIEANKDSGLRLDISIKNTNIVLDDFYIYYDQNDEMQNYLIEWNANHAFLQNDNAGHASHKNAANIRTASEDTARYSRLAQAYSREEAKVSFIWNVMNILCLGLVLCIMVYGIISINNYNKMKNMEKTIDYCLALITDNLQLNNEYKAPTSVAIDESKYERLTGSTAQEENTARQSETASASDTEAKQPSKTAQSSGTEAEQLSNAAQPSDTEAVQPSTPAQSSDTGAAQPSTTDEASAYAPQETADSGTEAIDQTAQSQTVTEALVRLDPEVPQINIDEASSQYYIVQQGDTLRTISYDVYGTYNMVDAICEWNKIENPDNILYGQRLLLPEK